MNEKLSRRRMITRAGACLGAGVVTAMTTAAQASETKPENEGDPFRYCLNMSTISGQKLPMVEDVEVAAKAGYTGIEPWIGKLSKYVEQGGSLKDLKKRIADLDLTVESAIGFATWGVDDDVQRAAGFEQMKRDMELIAEIGGTRIAAPPMGLHKTPADDLRQVAERYRTVLELGVESGVVPQLEIWGGAKTLGRLSEAIFVAIEAAHPDACLLLDVVHLHKGGSGFTGLRLLNGAAMHCFHINDYPTQPPPDVKGGDRVMPGDGVAPLTTMLRDLHATGFRGALSLELFNRTYYEMDALKAAEIGIEKIRQEVKKALRQVQGEG